VCFYCLIATRACCLHTRGRLGAATVRGVRVLHFVITTRACCLHLRGRLGAATVRGVRVFLLSNSNACLLPAHTGKAGGGHS